ncbi:unnamed protein product [Amoebophrya sp. A25]|nr:unnamed protein product [Amoebophrya sp. A25]|eukprot:GSA25T00021305001.1
MDTLGPLPPTAKGNRCVFVMVDEQTRWREVYLAPKKEAKHALEALKFWVKKHRVPECLLTDNGGEYTAKAVDEFLTSLNIRAERASPYSPQQNSTVERLSGVLMRSVRACVCGLKKSLWGYAMESAAHARNRMPREALDGLSPCEVWRKRKPSLGHMLPFYQRVMFRRYKYKNKVDEQREPGRFLYYSDFSSGYVVEDQRGNILQSPNCRVVDDNEPHTHGLEGDASDDDDWFGEDLCPDIPEDEMASFVAFADQFAKVPETEQAYLFEATTYGKAMKSADRGDWAEAIDAELQNFIDKDVYEEVDYDPEDPGMRKAMSMKMALVKKQDDQGKTTKHKARGVVLGNFQPLSDKIFSPVIRWATLRAVLVLAWSMGWSIFQCDISAAFLSAKISEPRYVFPPSCWRRPGKIWRLKRAVYEMRESGALWCQDISKYLISLGFERSAADASLYVRGDAILLLYVDDVTWLTRNNDVRDEIKQKIFDEYDAKEIRPEVMDGEPVYRFLGVRFPWGAERLRFFQRELVEKVLEQFGFEACRPAPTPMTEHDKTAPEPEAYKGYTVNAEDYRSFVGSIMYLQVATRWHLSYVTACLSMFLEQPGNRQFRIAKRLLRYLSGTKDLALECTRGKVGLSAFSDATYLGWRRRRQKRIWCDGIPQNACPLAR